MSKQTDNYAALAAAAGLRYDSTNNIIYGQKGGFDLLIYAADVRRYPYILTIHTSAKGTISYGLSQGDLKEFRNSLKSVSSVQQQGNNILIVMKGTNNQEKLKGWISETLGALEAFMQAKGFVPCCSNCGQSVDVVGYKTGLSYMHLCESCEGQLRGNFMNLMQKQQEKSENIVGGIIGALIGSLLGVVCIILLSQLGYVAAASGAVMSFGVLKGYELLGGKLTKRGVVIGVVVMLFMTYLGDRLDWAIMVWREVGSMNLNVSVFDCYRVIPDMLAEGIIDAGMYYGNLFLLYLFLLIGAVPTIRNRVKEKEVQVQMMRIGSAGSFNEFIQ